MHFSPPLIQGRLLRRYKRFLADVIDPSGEEITIHCPNTGAMTNCLVEGGSVWYSSSDNPKRKYAHTWEISSDAQGNRIGVNSARANALLEEALLKGNVPELGGYTVCRREYRLSNGKRLDFFLDQHPEDDRPCYLEVKSMTLMREQGLGEFPDAVSKRGTEHVLALAELARQGARAVLFFCVQHSAVNRFSVAADIDPSYAEALALAEKAGVEVLAYRTQFEENGLRLDSSIARA